MFSIIIPLFNKEKSIRRTIESVLWQSMLNFELIVVNDGSTDNSLTTVRNLNDPRIKIIEQKNSGVSSARNAGIQAARGEYIAFIDADDLWDKNYLSLMSKLIEDCSEASFYACQFAKISGENKEIVNDIHKHRGYIGNYFYEAIKAPLVCTSGIIVKRQCFHEIGLFNNQYKRGEDLEMWTRLARNYKFAFEPRVLTYYMLDDNNRACYTRPKLKYYYCEIGESEDERKYFAHLSEKLLIELILSRSYKNIGLLLIKLRVRSINMLVNIFKKWLGLFFK
jgi:glycosyltransferase involved in cell wall biosynthesis